MIYSAEADCGVDPGPSAGESAYLWFESPLSTLDHQSGGQKFKHMNSVCLRRQDMLTAYRWTLEWLQVFGWLEALPLVRKQRRSAGLLLDISSAINLRNRSGWR